MRRNLIIAIVASLGVWVGCIVAVPFTAGCSVIFIMPGWVLAIAVFGKHTQYTSLETLGFLLIWITSTVVMYGSLLFLLMSADQLFGGDLKASQLDGDR